MWTKILIIICVFFFKIRIRSIAVVCASRIEMINIQITLQIYKRVKRSR